MRQGDLSAPLFVPGDRPDRVRKARVSGAKAIIIDLEDAIPPSGKAAAREAAAAVLAEPADGILNLVRVNPVSQGELLSADISVLTPVMPSIYGVVVPKVVSAEQVRTVTEIVLCAAGREVAIIPTIESAAGVHEAWSIASAASSVETLLFGVVDLSAELGIMPTPGGLELLTARSALVLACANAGTRKPIDGPELNIRDLAGLSASALRARQLGFGGKIAIHPDQIAAISVAFAPTPQEIAWARRVLDAYDDAVTKGVGVVRTNDGTFVDLPVAERARSILRSAPATIMGGDAP